MKTARAPAQVGQISFGPSYPQADLIIVKITMSRMW